MLCDGMTLAGPVPTAVAVVALTLKGGQSSPIRFEQPTLALVAYVICGALTEGVVRVVLYDISCDDMAVSAKYDDEPATPCA